MRRHAFLLVALGILAGTFPSFAVELNDGTYIGAFRGGECGKMVITGGGANINYSYGPCGGSPTFRSAGKLKGNTIRIKAATYTISNLSKNSMKGRWELGTFTSTITFKKQ